MSEFMSEWVVDFVNYGWGLLFVDKCNEMVLFVMDKDFEDSENE